MSHSDQMDGKPASMLPIAFRERRQMRRCLVVARLQMAFSILFLIAIPIGGHAWIHLTWLWCVDRFQPIWKAGIVDVDALASYEHGALARDWMDIPNHLIRDPLLYLSTIVNVLTVLALAWCVLTVVGYCHLRKLDALSTEMQGPQRF